MAAVSQKAQYSFVAAVLFVAGWLRFAYPDWDAGQQAHPDEQYILWVATTIDWPKDNSAIFDPARTSLDPFRWPPDPQTSGVSVPPPGPRDFTYGHFPLYLLAFAGQALAWLGRAVPPLGGVPFVSDLVNAPGRIELDHLAYVGRALSALFDTASVLLAYLLGRKLFGAGAALLGAAFTALAVLHIQLAHFATFDTVLTAFCLLAVWAAIRYSETQSRRRLWLAGAAIGLAVGSKFSAALLAVPLAVAVYGPTLWEHGEAQVGWWGRAKTIVSLPLREWRGTLRWFEGMAVAAGVFALTNPFALIEAREYFRQITIQGLMVRGLLDWPFVLQYRNTAPYWYFVEQQARWLLGWPVTVAAYAGALAATWQLARKPNVAMAVALGWLWPYFFITGGFVVKFPRYMLPIVPLLLVLGAGWLVALAARRRTMWIAVAVVLGAMAVYAPAFVQMYAAPHPWVTLSEWIYRNVPRRSAVLVEKWDRALPLTLAVDGVVRSPDDYRVQTMDPFSQPDSEAKVKAMLFQLAAGDYLIVASNRVYGNVPRLPGRFPLSGGYYRALFAGKLGYEAVLVARRAPALFGWQLTDDPIAAAGLDVRSLAALGARDWNWGAADESFTAYDHPLAILFKNVGRLSEQEMWAAVNAH